MIPARSGPSRGRSTAPMLSALAVVGLVAAAWAVLVEPRPAWASGKQETCADSAALQCGFAGFPPGPMSICSSNQLGGACNSCNGTTGYRYCGSSAQTRACTPSDPLPTCGNPYTGTCSMFTYLFTYTYYLCSTTTANPAGNCTVNSACSGDVPAPKG